MYNICFLVKNYYFNYIFDSNKQEARINKAGNNTQLPDNEWPMKYLGMTRYNRYPEKNLNNYTTIQDL